jgi:hypothetical protein
MKKSYRILLWVISLAFLLPLLLETITFMIFIIVFSVSQQKSNEEHAKWVRNTPQEEKNILLTEDELEEATGLEFPPFNVIDMCPPEVFTMDPCYYWELELKEDFAKDYFDGLVRKEKFIFNPNDSTYTLVCPVNEDEENCGLELILDGRKVIIYDPFELKEEYAY